MIENKINHTMKRLTGIQGDEAARAIFSDCGKYRYILWRVWDKLENPMTWIMLNPSMADHTSVDPTIATCIRLAKREGCGGVTIMNLFGLRATNP